VCAAAEAVPAWEGLGLSLATLVEALLVQALRAEIQTLTSHGRYGAADRIEALLQGAGGDAS
jgi:hypothetical protein